MTTLGIIQIVCTTIALICCIGSLYFNHQADKYLDQAERHIKEIKERK